MKRILDHDPVSGMTEIYRSNPHDKTFSIQTVQDVAPYLDNNKELLAESRKDWKGDLHEVAEIPPVVWLQWWREFGSDPGSKANRARLKAKLNSNEWQHLRVKGGRI